jgi:hypothetical protein
VTISLGLLLVITTLLFWKLKGAQWPGLLLGLMIAKAATPGSIVDTLSGQALDLFNTVVNSIASAMGQGHVI